MLENKTQRQIKRDAKTREIMNAAELAGYLKISRHTVYQWINDSKIPFSYIKFDRAVRFDRKAVDHWLDSKTVKPVDSF